MARIRTVKPEFFKHFELFSLEKETNLPLRLAFQGLWLVADREGRFKWKPQQIKLDVLPYDPVDMEHILNILSTGEFITKYEVGGKEYGYIPSWNYHQRPNRDEPPSDIPSPSGELTLYDRPPNQTMRLRIYERDGYKCLYCNENLKDKSRSICLDHVVPYSEGGTNREQNLATSCKKCNQLKGNRTPDKCGLNWPKGLGERYVNNKYIPVNPPLTGIQHTVSHGQQVPDKERERERERESSSTGEKTVVGTELAVSTAKQVWEDQKWREQMCMAHYMKEDDLKRWMAQFNASVANDNFLNFDSIRYKKLFGGWLNTQKGKGYNLTEKGKTDAPVLKKL